MACPRKIRVRTLLIVLMAGLSMGCGDASRKSQPEFLTAVDAKFIKQHGQLYFVNDVRTGCQIAADRGLPCLFFFTAEWCTFCHRMAETAFSDPQVGMLGQNFVCVLVDAEQQRDVCAYFDVSGFPTVEFVSPQGQSLQKLVGQQSAENLAAGMQTALSRLAWLSGSQLR